MKSFFLIASKNGRAIPRSELDQFQGTIDRTINYARFVRSRRSCMSERGNVCLVALTNEPEVTPLVECDDKVVALTAGRDEHTQWSRAPSVRAIRIRSTTRPSQLRRLGRRASPSLSIRRARSARATVGSLRGPRPPPGLRVAITIPLPDARAAASSGSGVPTLSVT